MKTVPIAIVMLVAAATLPAGSLFGAIRADDRVAIQRLLTGSEDGTAPKRRPRRPVQIGPQQRHNPTLPADAAQPVGPR